MISRVSSFGRYLFRGCKWLRLVTSWLRAMELDGSLQCWPCLEHLRTVRSRIFGELCIFQELLCIFCFAFYALHSMLCILQDVSKVRPQRIARGRAALPKSQILKLCQERVPQRETNSGPRKDWNSPGSIESIVHISQHVFEGVRINLELRKFLTCKCILVLSKRTTASQTSYCNCGRRMISFLAVSFGSKVSTAAEPGSFPVQLYPFGAWSDSRTPPGCPVLPGRHPLSSTTVAATWMHPILKKWCSQGKAPGLSQTLTHGHEP